MTAADVEILAWRVNNGEKLCARIVRNSSGDLVTLQVPQKANKGGVVLLSAALTISLPAAAQFVDATKSTGKVATLTGTLHHPDGSPVRSGLIGLESAGHQHLPVYVADEIGNFEVDVPPGRYDLVVQTGANQAKVIAAVELHAGSQSVGEVCTRDAAPETVEMEPVLGTMSAHVRSVWSPRNIVRHPILFTRSLARRLS